MSPGEPCAQISLYGLRRPEGNMTDPLEQTAAHDPNEPGQHNGDFHVTHGSADDGTSPDGKPRAAVRPHEFTFLAPPMQPGELGRLGGYRILEVLGAGGMGVVFRAVDPHLRRALAIKVMRPQVAQNPASAERFLREARAAAAVKHDHIVTIYQVGQERGVPFIALEYLEGEPLDARIKRLGRLPPGEVARIGYEAALGLAAAHDAGLIHRDIKPGNIWLEAPNGRVKILDFGLARVEGDATHLTSERVVMGTPAYMPLEQANGDIVDHRADLFSLGVTLYKAASGAMPFSGANPLALLTALAFTDPVPLSAIAPDTPPVLAEVVMKLLARRAADRFANSHDVATALAAMAQAVPVIHLVAAAPEADPGVAFDFDESPPLSEGVEPEPAVTRAFPRRTLLLGGLLSAVTLGLSWGAYSALRPRKPAPDAPPPPETPPVAASGSFDRLDPAKIPHAELVPGHPKELVAVFGTRAHRHWGRTRGIAASADGRRLATIGGDPFVRVYDQVTLAPVAVMHADAVAPLTHLALSPNGNVLVVGGPARVEVWSLSGTPTRTHVIEFANRGLHLAADGKRLLVHSDAAARVYDLSGATPAPVGPDFDAATVLGKPGTFFQARLVGDGKRVVFACSDGTVRLQDLQSRQPAGELTPHPSPVVLSASRDEATLACQSADGLVRVWDVNGTEPALLREFRPGAAAGPIGTLALSPDGSKLVLLRRAYGSLWAVRGRSEKRPSEFRVAEGSVLAWAADGKQLIVGGSPQPDFLWTVDLSGQPVRTRPHTGHLAAPLVATAQGKVLVSEVSDDAANLAWYDANGTAPLREGDSSLPVSGGLAVNRAGTALFHAYKEFAQFNVAGKVPRQVRAVTLKAAPPYLDSVAVSGNGTVAVSGVSSDGARVWRLLGDRFEEVVALPNALPPFGLSPDGGTLVSAGPTLWDLKATPPQPRVVPKDFAAGKAWAVSADGRRLAVQGNAGPAIRVWDIANGPPKFVRELTGPGGGEPPLLAFAPDGASLALAGTDRDLRHRLVVWSVTDGAVRHDWPLPGALVRLFFAPDSRHLLTANGDGTGWVLRLPAS